MTRFEDLIPPVRDYSDEPWPIRRFELTRSYVWTDDAGKVWVMVNHVDPAIGHLAHPAVIV